MKSTLFSNIFRSFYVFFFFLLFFVNHCMQTPSYLIIELCIKRIYTFRLFFYMLSMGLLLSENHIMQFHRADPQTTLCKNRFLF